MFSLLSPKTFDTHLAACSAPDLTRGNTLRGQMGRTASRLHRARAAWLLGLAGGVGLAAASEACSLRRVNTGAVHGSWTPSLDSDSGDWRVNFLSRLAAPGATSRGDP